MESRGEVSVVCSGERVVLMKSESLSADLKANRSGALSYPGHSSYPRQVNRSLSLCPQSSLQETQTSSCPLSCSQAKGSASDWMVMPRVLGALSDSVIST